MTNAPSFSLEGQHVLVTGAGRGLGQAIALAVAGSGAIVSLVSRSQDELDATAEYIQSAGGRCRIAATDLRDPSEFDDLVADAWSDQPIDGVVHAAGIQVRRPAVEITPDDWDLVTDLNTRTPFFLSTAIARRQLADDRPGSHVLIGSLNSTIGLARVAPYAASKSALLGVARSLSTEWSASGLRVNVIGPGYFETKLTADLFADPANRARIMSRIPSGRLGQPADLGGAAVFLLSEASSYLTGQLINVDGGWLAS